MKFKVGQALGLLCLAPAFSCLRPPQTGYIMDKLFQPSCPGMKCSEEREWLSLLWMHFSEARKTSLSLLHVYLSGQNAVTCTFLKHPGKGDAMTGLDKPESTPKLQIGLASTGFCYTATWCKAGCQEESRCWAGSQQNPPSWPPISACPFFSWSECCLDALPKKKKKKTIAFFKKKKIKPYSVYDFWKLASVTGMWG